MGGYLAGSFWRGINTHYMSYTLSQDQAAALRQIGAWYRGHTAPYLTLGGYAGTGKTTLIAYLRQALNDLDETATVGFLRVYRQSYKSVTG